MYNHHFGPVSRVESLKIELKKINRSYKMGENTIHALRNIDLTIKEGDFISVTGPSGSGKTTLLNILGVLDKPTSGKILLDGKDISVLSEMSRSKIRLRKYGFIFQQFYLISSLTAFQNVYLPIKEAMGFGSKGKKIAMDLLEKVGMGDRLDHLPSQMSGGEQQRVAIARSLANDPPVILADEPTGELDSENSKIIMDILKDLNKDIGRSIVVVTHDPEVARRTKKSIKMKDGFISK